MLFCSLTYLEAWMKSPNVFSAPTNNLHLITSIQGYKKFMTRFAQTAWGLLNHHQWYINKELVALSLTPHASSEKGNMSSLETVPWALH